MHFQQHLSLKVFVIVKDTTEQSAWGLREVVQMENQLKACTSIHSHECQPTCHRAVLSSLLSFADLVLNLSTAQNSFEDDQNASGFTPLVLFCWYRLSLPGTQCPDRLTCLPCFMLTWILWPRGIPLAPRTHFQVLCVLPEPFKGG